MSHYTLVQSNDLAKFSVLRIKEYFSNQVQGRKCVPPDAVLPRSRNSKF